MLDLKDKLNPSQLLAVSETTGPVLVIAGAGSGKTRAIEYRVLNLVTKGVRPESILLLTFTRRAAREMVERASRHDPRCARVDGGTFHSFAFRMLKRYAKALGFSNDFSVLDESDSSDAVGRCASKIGIIGNDARFPKKDTIKRVLSASINKAQPIIDILDMEYPHFLEYAPYIEKIKKAYAGYKKEKGYFDYDDLLVYLKLLLEIEDTRKAVAHRYDYVMVDEYQDTNPLQGDIAYLLARDHKNIMAVGDDAQSIYGFRGSSHKNIMEFPKKFKECKVIKLEENYRSAQNILDVANSVLENMSNKYSKCLISTREDAGDRPVMNFFRDNYEEADWITAKISELREQGVGLENQAVLFRSAYVSISLQAQLSQSGIPYQVFGGMKFYETSHVKDILSYLKIAVNPKDEIAWHRALTMIDGIGPKTADKIVEDIVSSALDEKKLPRKSLSGIARLKKFLSMAHSGGKPDPLAVYDAAFDYYLPIFQVKFDDHHTRINDLEALRQIASQYDSIEELLSDFAIEPPDKSVLRPRFDRDEAAGKPLTLSTIHSAKGLEWDSVFLIGLVDGVLPSSFSFERAENIEEESRLFYVAITRAKNRLFLSFNQEGTRGNTMQFNKVSRFVEAPNVFTRLEGRFAVEKDMDYASP